MVYFHFESSQESWNYFHFCDNKILVQELEQMWSLSVTDGHIFREIGVCGDPGNILKCWVEKKLETGTEEEEL